MDFDLAEQLIDQRVKRKKESNGQTHRDRMESTTIVVGIVAELGHCSACPDRIVSKLRNGDTIWRLDCRYGHVHRELCPHGVLS